jgi:hypothetical protein
VVDRPGMLRIPRPARGHRSVSARTFPQSADLQSPDSRCVVVSTTAMRCNALHGLDAKFQQQNVQLIAGLTESLRLARCENDYSREWRAVAVGDLVENTS